MSNTANLDLERPDKGDPDWDISLNSNMTKLDTGYGNNVASIADLPEVYIETGTFNHDVGDVITLPKSVDAINEYNVTITPTTGAGIDIGFIYVTKAVDTFTVYCTGNNHTDTYSATIYYIGDVASYGGSIYRRWYVSPDATITDHGDDTDVGSFAWVLDQIGATAATVEFPGNKAYVISTSIVSPANIDLIFQNEAVLTDDGSNADLTISGTIRAGNYQVFNWGNGSGSVSIADHCESIWFDGSDIDQVLNSGAKTIHINSMTHTLTATGSLSSGQVIYGNGNASLINLGANISALTIDGLSNVLIKDFKIDGKKVTYTTDSNIGITSLANGTGSSHIRIEGMNIVDMAGGGIQFLAQTGSHSENITIVGNTIEDPGASGILTQDFVDNVIIRGNKIINWGADVASKIGIVTGRDGNNHIVSDNYLESDGGAGGASMHGISIDKCIYATVSNNIVTGSVGFGIEIGNSQNTSVLGNETHLTTRSGIAIVGDETVQTCKHITVTGNTVFEPSVAVAGIYATVSNQVAAYNEDLVIVGNNIHNSQAGPGILIDESINGVVSNNVIVDSYTDGIRFEDSSFFIVNGNLLKGSNANDTAARQLGVVKSTSTSIIVNGFAEVDTTDKVTVTTGEDDLKTYSIPRETYNDWRGMRVTAAGIKAGANGNKTLKFHIGASSLTFNAAANDTNDWIFKADIPFYAPTSASDSYYVIWTGFNGTTLLTGFEYWPVDNTAAAVEMKITGECAHASDVIYQNTWMVEFY